MASLKAQNISFKKFKKNIRKQLLVRQLEQGAVANSIMVTDQEAVGACANFLDHHRVLVEPACGAALALAYSERHWPVLQRYDSVVFVVCGGGGVNEEILRGWKRDILGPAA